MKIDAVLSEIESFFASAATAPGIKARFPTPLKPATEKAIGAFLTKHKLDVPDDVRRFWQRGLKYRTLSLADDTGDDSFATAGFDWYSLKNLEREVSMFRGLAKPLAEGSDEKLVYERGLPLSYTEPQLVLDPRGGISHVHSANPLTPPVASSLTEFLEHWLEAGCFTSHQIGAYLPKIQHLVPGRIPPEKNSWIAHYKKTFPEFA
jgi:hypothetical protein